MKKLAAVVLAAVLCVTFAMPALAGGWQLKDNNHWMWISTDANGNVTIPKAAWWWIDDDGDGAAECYCFDENGYLYESAKIGKYAVNFEGQWSDDEGSETAYVQFCGPWSEWFDSSIK